ncbi:Myotubularin-related protein 2 [Geodia barretti]|uniref:Myotubularin-related protein 2 n=4 Tax=Geodia barretti TaxID=519541 RepID=A0AA35TYW1_GEOBA|nr:Myotubularin-related protein 2 [Geodia barretti]
MNGFQILVQKEWLWFGHPFESRHTRHGRVKDDGPVFLQWVDCVWQVFHQCPSAFEFNEKFLMVMVESSYSGQFGSFLLNNEQERHKTLADEAHKHKSVATHTLSFWTWVGMVNAAGRTFFNHLYDPHTYPWVIYPNCAVPCLKLWTRHYSQSKYQQHLQHSANTTPLQKQLDQLVREYQMLSSKTEVGTSPRTPSIALPPAIADKEPQRNSFGLERERERVRQSGRSIRSKTPAHCQNIQEYLTSQGIDCSVCKHAVIVGNTCQGLLVKLGGVRKHWQERWFVLDFASQLLTYFENKEEFTTTDRGTPKGVIELTNMTRVWQNDRKKDHLVRHIFTVVTKDRTYLFRAPSLLTMQMWIAVLNMPRTTVALDS